MGATCRSSPGRYPRTPGPGSLPSRRAAWLRPAPIRPSRRRPPVRRRPWLPAPRRLVKTARGSSGEKIGRVVRGATRLGRQPGLLARPARRAGRNQRATTTRGRSSPPAGAYSDPSPLTIPERPPAGSAGPALTASPPGPTTTGSRGHTTDVSAPPAPRTPMSGPPAPDRPRSPAPTARPSTPDSSAPLAFAFPLSPSLAHTAEATTTSTSVSEVPSPPGEGAAVRAVIGQRHGIDLSAVPVDRSPEGAGQAQRLSARAFTSQSGVVIPAGAGHLDAGPGAALLAHELTHVAQRARLRSAMPPEQSPAGRGLEAEARAAELSFASPPAPRVVMSGAADRHYPGPPSGDGAASPAPGPGTATATPSVGRPEGLARHAAGLASSTGAGALPVALSPQNRGLDRADIEAMVQQMTGRLVSAPGPSATGPGPAAVSPGFPTAAPVRAGRPGGRDSAGRRGTRDERRPAGPTAAPSTGGPGRGPRQPVVQPSERYRPGPHGQVAVSVHHLPLARRASRRPRKVGDGDRHLREVVK